MQFLKQLLKIVDEYPSRDYKETINYNSTNQAGKSLNESLIRLIEDILL